jgi:hypothetical protein
VLSLECRFLLALACRWSRRALACDPQRLDRLWRQLGFLVHFWLIHENPGPQPFQRGRPDPMDFGQILHRTKAAAGLSVVLNPLRHAVADAGEL